MCGIAGAITYEAINELNIKNAKESLRRRGPDHNYHTVNRNMKGNFITLIHTRLSILDLDKRSNQPMQHNNINLIFNGEIYNYIELRNDLSKYIKFNTNSDTEVLLKLIKKKGIEALQECEGMFALSFYNSSLDKVFLARDKFGEKPLYFYKHKDGSLFFGSEPKAIFALLGFKLPINYEHIRRFLVNGYKSLFKENFTFFEGLEEVKPGYCIEIKPFEKFLNYPWINSKVIKQNDAMSYQDAVAGTKERLYKSLEIRLRSDVPMSFCLSGGIDSNALVAIAKKIFDYEVHGFTIMNSDLRYEEREMVEHSVKNLKIKHTSIPINKNNFLENLSTIVKYHDSPISTISYYAHWLLMESISNNGYKVNFSGTGADELFSGYYDHHLAYLSEIQYSNKELFKKSLSNWIKYIKPHVRNPFLQKYDYFINNPNSRDHIFLESDKYSQYLTYPFKEEFQEKIYTPFLLRNRMANELFNESVPVILHEDDLNAMYFSIENRSPYLDSKLYDWSLSIPTKFLIKDGLAKSILRDSVRGIVPTKILNNSRKVGFNVPIDDYIDFSNLEVISEITKASNIDEIVNSSSIKLLLQSKNRSNEESKFVFNYLTTRLFLDAYS